MLYFLEVQSQALSKHSAIFFHYYISTCEEEWEKIKMNLSKLNQGTSYLQLLRHSFIIIQISITKKSHENVQESWIHLMGISNLHKHYIKQVIICHPVLHRSSPEKEMTLCAPFHSKLLVRISYMQQYHNNTRNGALQELLG